MLLDKIAVEKIRDNSEPDSCISPPIFIMLKQQGKINKNNGTPTLEDISEEISRFILLSSLTPEVPRIYIKLEQELNHYIPKNKEERERLFEYKKKYLIAKNRAWIRQIRYQESNELINCDLK